MFNNQPQQPVNMLIVEHTYVEGRLVMQGTILRDCEPNLALELAGAGKARPATDEDIAAAAAAAAASKAPAKAAA